MMNNPEPAKQPVQKVGCFNAKRSRQLFGREKLTSRLLSAFEKTSQGACSLLLVSGHSGTGKTSLIEWLQEPVADQNGIFVQGKFDQYQQKTPYFPIRRALADLWETLEAFQGPDKTDMHRQIRRSLGEHGSFLLDFIPELKGVIAANDREENISPLEAQHRFISTLQTFIQFAAKPEHPVVMFIDDWQWADNASLELLRTITAGTTLNYFLLIASYRDEEIMDDHPLLPVLRELAIQNHPPEKITVPELGHTDIKKLLMNTFPGQVEQIDTLVSIVQKQTSGNPFYAVTFLEFLHVEGAIRFDIIDSCWKWNIDQKCMPVDIVELFFLRLQKFPPEARELISLAACLGNRFVLKNLISIFSGKDINYAHSLNPLVQTGLLIKKKREEQGTLLNHDQEYAFLHDRVQQAAFQLIPQEQIHFVHLKIGERLLSILSKEELEEQLYEVLGHLNQAIRLVRDPDKQKLMIALNRKAAKKAEDATAYRSMLDFYRSAFTWAELYAGGSFDQYFSQEYADALDLTRNRARSEFLEGDADKAEQLIHNSLRHTKSAVDQAETLNIMIVHYTLTARYQEAIETGRTALAALDIILPESDYAYHRDKAIAECMKILENQPVNSLQKAPFMESVQYKTAAKLLITLGPPCYRTHQHLWSVIVPKVVLLTLKHGLIPQIGYSYTAFGGLLGWVQNDYETARELGEVAEIIMNDRVSSQSDRSVFYLMVGSSIRHWFKHLSYAGQDYMNAYEIGRQSGNMQYAAYAFGHNMYCSFYQSLQLDEIIRVTRQNLIFSRTRLNQWAIDLLEGGLRLFTGLANNDEDNADDNDADYIKRVSSHGNIQVLCIYHVLKSFILMLLGKNREAYQCNNIAGRDIHTVGTQGLLPWPEYIFCRFLVISAIYQTESREQQDEWLRTLNYDLQQLQIWRSHCPDNYQHKYLLAKAELSRISNNKVEAADLYDQAIQAAKAGRFLHYEGIANERAALFWQHCGNGIAAQIYWRQAYICYGRWGAKAKMKLMEQQYAQQLGSWYQQSLQPSDNGKKLDPGSFIKKHLELLKNQSEEKLEAEFHRESSLKAGELALATEKLRKEIAERKRLEKERTQLEEEVRQRRKSEAIGTLAGGIAHEFNNMLAIIMGNLELIEDEITGNTSALDFLEDIKQTSFRAKEVVEKIHRFARNVPAKKEAIKIRELIEDTLSLLRKTVPATVRFHFITTFDAAMVLADANELSQAVVNLCNNSIHAMQKQGTVELLLEQVSIMEETARLSPGTYVRLSITDTGCGIEPAIIDRVFDPYFTTKDVDEGLGMGLSVVQGIINSHQGEVTIQSEVAKGTRVMIMLPQLEDMKNTSQSAAMPGEQATGEHILLVDDELSLLRLTTRNLMKAGYVVTGRNKPEEALAVFSEQPHEFNLIISDMSMPSMTGIQLLSEIRKNRADIPAIILTGFSDLLDKQAMNKNRVSAVVSKPFQRQELLKTIQKILREDSS